MPLLSNVRGTNDQSGLDSRHCPLLFLGPSFLPLDLPVTAVTAAKEPRRCHLEAPVLILTGVGMLVTSVHMLVTGMPSAGVPTLRGTQPATVDSDPLIARVISMITNQHFSGQARWRRRSSSLVRSVRGVVGQHVGLGHSLNDARLIIILFLLCARRAADSAAVYARRRCHTTKQASTNEREQSAGGAGGGLWQQHVRAYCQQHRLTPQPHPRALEPIAQMPLTSHHTSTRDPWHRE